MTCLRNCLKVALFRRSTSESHYKTDDIETQSHDNSEDIDMPDMSAPLEINISDEVPEVSGQTLHWKTSHQGERKKTNVLACVYCQKLLTKLPLHFERCHKEETEVQGYLSMSKKSKEWKSLLQTSCIRVTLNTIWVLKEREREW